MSRLHFNRCYTFLDGALDAIDDTNIPILDPLKEGGLAGTDIPSVVAPDTLDLCVDDEIITVTAYTSGATVLATVLRGQGDTPAATHATGARIFNGAAKEDFSEPFALPYVVVAADGAPTAWTDIADFVCDGVGDEVQLQAAWDALPAGGGEILLSPGSFYVNDDVVIGSGKKVVWRAGKAMFESQIGNVPTQIYRENLSATNFAIFNITSATARNEFIGIGFYGGDDGFANTSPLIATSGNGAGFAFRGCGFQNDQVAGNVLLATSACAVTFDECRLLAEDTCVATSGTVALVLVATSSEMVSNTGLGISSPAINANSAVRLVDTTIRGTTGGISIIGASFSMTRYVEIIGGSICSEPASATELAALITNCFVNITGTILGDLTGNSGGGLKLTGCTRAVVTGTENHFSPGNGIWVLDTSDALIEGNLVYGAGRQTTSTYAGILLDGDTNRCAVLANNVKKHSSGNNALYGIRVDDSTCDDNCVEGNDIYNSTVTAGNEFSDAGTATRGWRTMELAYVAGVLTVAAGVKRNRFEAPAVLGLTYLNVNTAPTDASLIVDVHKNAVTVYTTQGNRPVILTTAFAGNSTVQPDVKAMAAGDYLTADVDQIGSTIAGSELVVHQRYMPL